jgi:ribonuclease HII
MKRLANHFPHYHLGEHKGYATKTHYDALYAHQSSIIHRQSFLNNYHQALNAHLDQQLELF